MQKGEGILITKDYSKAFDTLSYINGAFNFSSNIIDAINICYRTQAIELFLAVLQIIKSELDILMFVGVFVREILYCHISSQLLLELLSMCFQNDTTCSIHYHCNQ